MLDGSILLGARTLGAIALLSLAALGKLRSQRPLLVGGGLIALSGVLSDGLDRLGRHWLSMAQITLWSGAARGADIALIAAGLFLVYRQLGIDRQGRLAARAPQGGEPVG